MISNQIKKPDIEMVKAFITREAQDFSLKWEHENEEAEWIEAVFSLIQEQLKQKEHINYLAIVSYGNVGCLSRKLVVDVRNWDYEGKVYDYECTLCPCGRLDHTAFLDKNGVIEE